MARLSEEVERQVVDAARQARGNATAQVAVGRRLLIKRHCGERMVQVTFRYPDGPKKAIRGSDLHVCTKSGCTHTEIPWWQEPDPN